MGADEVVRSFWARVQARDWAGVHAVLAPDVVLEWPASGERFHGADAVVTINREYPEGWSIDVIRVVADPDGETVVSEVEVPQDGVGSFAAASFWQVRDGVITAGREYWVACAGEEPPPWRAPYATRYTGRLRSRLAPGP